MMPSTDQSLCNLQLHMTQIVHKVNLLFPYSTIQTNQIADYRAFTKHCWVKADYNRAKGSCCSRRRRCDSLQFWWSGRWCSHSGRRAEPCSGRTLLISELGVYWSNFLGKVFFKDILAKDSFLMTCDCYDGVVQYWDCFMSPSSGTWLGVTQL